MSYGKIVGNAYIKNEDEKQKLRMGGGSWSINLSEISDLVEEIIYITNKAKYKIDKDVAIAKGFIRSMSTKGVVENKLIVPIKHWVMKTINDIQCSKR